MSKITLLKAVEISGGPGALATEIKKRMPGSKVSRAHVYKWLNKSIADVPPAEYVLAIADAVDWRLTPNELRPDLYPNALDAIPPEVALMVTGDAA